MINTKTVNGFHGLCSVVSMMNFRKESTMLLPLLLCVTFAAANEAEIECFTCVKVDAQCHNLTHVLDFQAPFRETVVITKLGILNAQNTLYYAFEPKIDDPEYYKVGYVNLDTPETRGVLVGGTPIMNFRTFDIDQDKKVIYLGGGDGIFVSNDGGNATYFSSRGDTIQNIFYKKNVFFIRYGENVIVEKEGELFKPYEEYKQIKNFIIERNNILVYLNISGLYANKMGTNDTVHLSKNAFFRGLTIDRYGVVYAWWIDGIYKVIIQSVFELSRIVKIADITSIGAITFDKDNNLMFSSEQGLYRLDVVPSNATTC